MRIVISIPDELYNAINKDTYGVHRGRIYDIVRGGSALPKGHGRLIDADALDKSLEKEQEDLDNDELSNAFGDGLTWASEVLSKEPTIIEADTESEE